MVIANRLAQNSSFENLGNDSEGYPLGFGKDQQGVLMHSFLAAYSGVSPETVSLNPIRSNPLPNWNWKFTGLS